MLFFKPKQNKNKHANMNKIGFVNSVRTASDRKLQFARAYTRHQAVCI